MNRDLHILFELAYILGPKILEIQGDVYYKVSFEENGKENVKIF